MWIRCSVGKGSSGYGRGYTFLFYAKICLRHPISSDQGILFRSSRLLFLGLYAPFVTFLLVRAYFLAFFPPFFRDCMTHLLLFFRLRHIFSLFLTSFPKIICLICFFSSSQGIPSVKTKTRTAHKGTGCSDSRGAGEQWGRHGGYP